jgi:hypothetical protein
MLESDTVMPRTAATIPGHYIERCMENSMPRQYTRTPITERLSRYGARQENGCLFWTGSVNPNGYGQMTIGGKTEGAHVIAYRMWVGEIPNRRQVHHLCDVMYAPGDTSYRRCFEPKHLTIGTPAQNSRHMAETGRSASGDRHVSRKNPSALLRGHSHPNAHLTEVDIIEIRRRRSENKTPYRLLGEAFGITLQTAWRIVHYKAWSHVTDSPS